VNVVIKTLRLVVPIAKDAVGVIWTEDDFKQAKSEMELMKTVSDKLPGDAPMSKRVIRASAGGDYLGQAEGEALRAFRVFLFETDKSRHFGGLRRVQGPEGDFYWVCEHHYSIYDPGLPTVLSSAP
jgi:hypothetical protein